MTQRGTKVSCSYCLHASVPAAKKCLQCKVSLCQKHLRVHRKSYDHTLTGVHDHTLTGVHDHTLTGVHDHTLTGVHDHTLTGVYDHTLTEVYDHTLTEASPTSRRCLQHGLEFSSFCSNCRVCLCCKCQYDRVHEDHSHLNLSDAYEAKKRRLNEALGEWMVKREKIPDQIQQLELARDRLTQKIGTIISLAGIDDPLTLLQEEESERSDFYDIQDSDRRFRELREQHRLVVEKNQEFWRIIIILLFMVLLVVIIRRPENQTR